MPRDTSAADRELADQLKAAGSRRSPRRMGEHGLLGERAQRGLGYAAGSESIRPADEFDRALEGDQLLSEHRSYDRAVLVMFARGRFEISKSKLDSAYSGALASLRRGIEKQGRPAVDTPEISREAATRFAREATKAPALRALRIRLREERPRFISVREQLASLAEDVFLTLLTGRTTSTQAFKELLDAVAMTEVLTDPTTGRLTEPLRVETVAEMLPHASIAAMIERARETPPSALAQDRDDAKLFRDLARAYGPCLQRVLGWRRAFPWLIAGSASDVSISYAAAAIGWLRERYPDEYQEFFDKCPAWVAQYQAFNALLDFLPEHLQWQPGAYKKLDPEARAELATELLRFAESSPKHFAIISAP